MNLGKWLKDREKDIVNRWQNSVVLDAVSSGTQADQIRRAQQGPRTINQQASDTYGKGFSAPVNRVRDLFDANTRADQLKRLANTGLNETYQQEQNRLTQEAVGQQSDRNLVNQFSASGLRNIGNRLGTIPGNFSNVIGAAMKSDIVDKIPGLNLLDKVDNLTGNKISDKLQQRGQDLNSFVENKVNQSQLGERTGENKWAVSGGQITTDLPMQIVSGVPGLVALGADTTSDQYDAARKAGKTNDEALGIGLLQGTANAVSEKIGMDRFLPGNGVTGNLLTRAGKRFLTEGAQEGQQQFTENLITNKTYNPNQSLTQGVPESVILGGISGGITSPVIDISGPSQDIKQEVVKSNPILQQTGVPAAPGSLRERIQIAKDNVTNTITSKITPMNQGGYIQLPNGRREVVTNKPSAFPDFQEDVKLGRISDNVETVPRNTLQKGPGTDGTGIDQARVQEYQQMIRNDTPIAPMITDPTGKLINDGQNRLAAFAREGITDVPIVREIPKKKLSGAALQSQMSKQSSNKVYTHYTDTKPRISTNPNRLIPNSISLQEGKGMASAFGKNKFEFSLNQNTNIFKVSKKEWNDIANTLPKNASNKDIGKAIGDYAKRNGYDGVRIDKSVNQPGLGTELAIFNKDKLIPKEGFGDFKSKNQAQAKAEYEATVGKRPEADLQLKIEQARNAGDIKTTQQLESQLKDQGLNPDAGKNVSEKITLYRSGDINSKRGSFFSDNRDIAGTYSTNPVKGESGRSLIEYQLNENTKLKKFIGGQLDHARELGINVNDIKSNLQKEYDSGKVFRNENNMQQETLMRVEDLIKNKLSKQGFDGVEYTGDYYGTPYKEYHLFNPDKSINTSNKPSLKEKLGIKSLNEGGYIKNPLAKSTKLEPSKQVEANNLVEFARSPFATVKDVLKVNKRLKELAGNQDGYIKNPLVNQQSNSKTKSKKPLVENLPSISDRIVKSKQPISRFSKRAKTSEEISPELQAKIKPVAYEKQTNKKQIETSTKLINKGYKKAAIDVSARLDVKDSGTDAQTVSDAIATIKKLDEKGNPNNLQQASELFDKLSKRLTEAGQTVQAASLLYNRTPQGLYYSAKRTLNKAGVEITPKLDNKLKTLLKDVKATKADTNEGGLARFKFIEEVNKSVPSGRADKVVQIWKAGLLSGPITQVGNFTANTFEQSTKRFYEDPVATGVDILMSVFTGKRSKSLTARGTLTGAKEGIQKGISYFKTGFDPRNPAQKFDIRNIHYSDTPLGRAAEKYTQTIFRSMGTADQPFYYTSMRNSLYDQAITEAKNQGLKGMKRASFIKDYTTQPSKKALQLADTEARYDVFQNKTKLGQMASGFKGKSGALGDFIIPFSGVPSSIATRIVERTPIGTAIEVVNQMKSGKFDQRRMSQAIARGSTGIVLVGIGKALASAGLITLGYPQDDDEAKLWKLEGKQAFSVKIGNKWRSLNYFQPAGTLLAAGATYQQAKKEGKSESDAWNTAIATMGKAFTEQSFLRGISGVLNAVTDPKSAGEKFTENTVASTVPNWLRAPTRAFDSVQREVNTPLDAIKGGIPGLRQTLMAKNNPYGEDLQRNTSGINSLLNPTRPSDAKETDNTTKELRRLQDSGNGIMPITVKKDTLGKDVEKLTDKQINELERYINPMIKNAWDQVISNNEYKNLSDEEKMKTLRKIKEDLVAIGKREYSSKNGIGIFSQNYTGEDKGLTKSQLELLNSGDFNKYIKTTNNTSNTTKTKKATKTVTTKKGKSSSRKTNISRKNISQTQVNELKQSTLSRLNSLLSGTQKPVIGQKKVASQKAVLKKITVKA